MHPFPASFTMPPPLVPAKSRTASVAPKGSSSSTGLYKLPPTSTAAILTTASVAKGKEKARDQEVDDGGDQPSTTRRQTRATARAGSSKVDTTTDNEKDTQFSARVSERPAKRPACVFLLYFSHS